MKPNTHIQGLREYPVVSHKAWNEKNKKAILKADWNEADVALPAVIKKELVHFIQKGPTYWYPDVANEALVREIAAYIQVPQTHVQYFEGSDAGLDYAARTFLKAGDEVVIAGPTYDNFRVYVESLGAKTKFVLNKNIFAPNISLLEKNISSKTKAVYIVNPNNPTGIAYTKKDIEHLVRTHPKTFFIIDEAYAEFGTTTVIPLTKKYNNLMVSRSFSKAFALASFRIGYIVSAPENITHINKIRNGKNIAMLSQIAALAALRNRAYMTAYVKESRKARELVCRELTKRGISIRNTPANFVLLHTSQSFVVRQMLEKQGIFVRSLDHLPHMQGYLRITVGSIKGAKHFLRALKTVSL